MCFSATASFVTAAFTGTLGLTAMARAATREQLPLAAVPLIFSVQQSLEGLLWLWLPDHPESPGTSLLVSAFLMFAKVVWPLLIPFAVALVEPDRGRSWAIAACCIAGSLAGAFFLRSLLTHSHSAVIQLGHISYSSEPYLPLVASAMYIIATCGAPLLSSHASIKLLGAIVTVGSLVTYVFYWEAFTSVWCFFAAAASCVIAFHFEKARQLRRAIGTSVSPS